ncbi:MAG: hypothetical protein HY812_19880 [Planctomycetes bacterium]|nr:hypothetical protein [Planctomycetota bacterium]
MNATTTPPAAPEQPGPPGPKALSTSRSVLVPAVFVAIPLLWALSPVILSLIYPDFGRRGQFGDSFGGVNALFSGLAFAGVVYAIVLQRRELQQASRDLDLTRRELARTATAAQISAMEATRTRSATALFEVMSLLDHLRPRIHQLYALADDSETWTEEQRKLADHVATGLERIAYISMSGLLEPEYLMAENAQVFVRSWEKLRSFVFRYRQEAGEPESLEAGGFQRKHFELLSLKCEAYVRQARDRAS